MRSAGAGPLALVLLSACSAAMPATTLTPEQVTALDARRTAHAKDPATLTDVGIRFYQGREYTRAHDALAAAVALDSSDFRAVVHLGLVAEAQGNLDAAGDAYHHAERLRISRTERATVEARLVALTRQRLAAEARRALAAEQTLAATPPLPNSIAVLPWTYTGQNPELQPLERGMAHLVLTDLAKLSRFTLLERERVQALTDELAMAGAGRLDVNTAARSGRLLRASEVLSGSIRETDPGSIRLDASIVAASDAQVKATGTASDRLQQLFVMEKAVVFDLLNRMGVNLTPAERQALSERPTASVQSFLSFSRGLLAEDRGDWSGAAKFFDEAAREDPGFRAARERARRTVGAKVNPAKLAEIAERRVPASDVRGAQLASALQNIAPTLAARVRKTPGKIPATIKSRLAEALRQDDPTRVTSAAGLPPTTIPRP